MHRRAATETGDAAGARRARVLPGGQRGRTILFHMHMQQAGPVGLRYLPLDERGGRREFHRRAAEQLTFASLPPIPGSPGKSGGKPSLRIARLDRYNFGVKQERQPAPSIAFARSGHAHRGRVPRRGAAVSGPFIGNAFGLGSPAGRRLIHAPGAPGAPPAAQDLSVELPSRSTLIKTREESLVELPSRSTLI